MTEFKIGDWERTVVCKLPSFVLPSFVKKIKTNRDEALNRRLINYVINGDLKGVKDTIEQGVNIHAGDDYALRHASENGHTEIVELLLESGANVHARNDYALRWATRQNNTEIVNILRAHIAKMNEKQGD